MDVIVNNFPYLMSGLKVTLLLALGCLIGTLVGGALLATLRMAPVRALSATVAVYIDVVRMVPLLMVIFWTYFLGPILFGVAISPFNAALIGIIVSHSTYMAEVFRAGIRSVPSGLLEAGRASGLGYAASMWHIVMPIATRRMLPAIVTRFVATFMATSLAYAIGTTEFFRAATNVNNRVFAPYEIYGFVAVVFFMFCWSLSLLGKYLQGRLAVEERPVLDRSV